VTPGVCEIVGASSPRKWEESTGPGLSGAILWYRGIALSHFSLRLTLYTVDDWTAWESFRGLVKRPAIGKFGRAMDIEHPILAELGIVAVVIEDVRAPDQVENGVWMIEIMLIEYRRLTAAQGKADGAAADEHDPVEDLIQKLHDQADSLAAEGNALP
jgi:hypothetical protein